jgi:acyl-CoA synthetase (AMP-forming)/AMP-acid ligase II/acyl carrier protein
MEGSASDSLREMLKDASQQHPHGEALLAPGRQPLTFGMLFEQVERVGASLRARGIHRSARVAVALPNGPEMATAFLGIAAYATCAPLNPLYRPEELEFYLSDLGAEAIVLASGSNPSVREVAQRQGLAVLNLEAPAGKAAGVFVFQGTATTSTAPADWARGDEVALVLHTSGTTSRPKLVPLSHRNLCASARSVSGVLRLHPTDRALNVMPLFHIHGLVGVLLASLWSRGSVVCTPGFDPASFGIWLREFQPTWYSAVPTIHQEVLACTKANPGMVAGHRLRLIRSSSSALPPRVMAELESCFGVPVIEAYGMTEAAHQMASNPLPPAVRKAGSVGLPAGPEMAVMDDDGALLPAEATGEIVIRGANVTAGYSDNAEANRSAFTQGWFRTGDLGRRDDEGYLYLTGRKKEMINRGGEKIAPREIDEALLEHPAVAQAVAFAVPHPTLGEDLAAAVVLQAADAVSEGDLRRFLFGRLAGSKVPSRIVMVAAIPKGPTQKLQRIGLHEALAEQLRADYVAPRTNLEAGIIGVMEQVLGAKRVGVTDNFFALGGDSLKAVRVLGRLCNAFCVELPATTLFVNPTARELAVEITRLLGEVAAELEELLDEIEGLSDAEAARLTAEATSRPPSGNADPLPEPPGGTATFFGER